MAHLAAVEEQVSIGNGLINRAWGGQSRLAPVYDGGNTFLRESLRLGGLCMLRAGLALLSGKIVFTAFHGGRFIRRSTAISQEVLHAREMR